MLSKRVQSGLGRALTRQIEEAIGASTRSSGTMWAMTYEEALTREARRLSERYVSEVVQRFDLCPWAARSLREGRVKTLILLQDSPTHFEASLSAMADLGLDRDVEIGFLVFPRLALGRLDFEHFARQLRTLDADRHEVGAIPFAMAAFHPDAAPDTTDPERLIPFLRRTPDPTLQLVRYSALERVRGQFSQGTEYFDVQRLGTFGLPERRPATLREHVSKANWETVERVGLDEVRRVLDDLCRDREESYRALAERAAAGML